MIVETSRGGLLLLALTVLLTTGCNSVPRRDPEYAVSYPPVYADPAARQAATGAIYQAGYDIALYGDVKARRIGDILTIVLSENHNAEKTAESEIGRSTNASVTNPTLFGTTPRFDLPSVLPLASTQNNTLESSLASSHDFEGEADSKLSNRLTGNVTVTVADVLPNGNLVVRGEKRLNLNQGNEYIKISGIVRPVDIATDNTVPSTKVADATIVYNGDGAIADSNRAGWLTRLFNSAFSPL